MRLIKNVTADITKTKNLAIAKNIKFFFVDLICSIFYCSAVLLSYFVFADEIFDYV